MKDRRITLELEGAMQICDVWVNGEHRLTHLLRNFGIKAYIKTWGLHLNLIPFRPLPTY